MKSILLFGLLAASLLGAAPGPFQSKLEAYVDAFPSMAVDQPQNFTSPRSFGVVMLTKCSDTVVLLGHRPTNFVRAEEDFDETGGSGGGEGSSEGNPVEVQADVVANVLPQVVATFSARYHVALTPIASRTDPGSSNSVWATTGYLLILTPRADIQPFPSLAMRRVRRG